MSELLLSILTPSIPSRFAMVQALSEKIQAQIGDLPVEHLILTDNKKISIGMKREALIQMARGKMVAFLDDDDDCSPVYCSSIVKAIEDHPDLDVITFRQHACINGAKFTVDFGLEYGNEQAQIGYDGLYADIKRKPYHICPWRRTLAQKYHFPDSGYGEDFAWVSQLWPEAKHEFHIDAVLHTYRFNEKTSEAPDERKRK